MADLCRHVLGGVGNANHARATERAVVGTNVQQILPRVGAFDGRGIGYAAHQVDYAGLARGLAVCIIYRCFAVDDKHVVARNELRLRIARIFRGTQLVLRCRVGYGRAALSVRPQAQTCRRGYVGSFLVVKAQRREPHVAADGDVGLRYLGGNDGPVALATDIAFLGHLDVLAVVVLEPQINLNAIDDGRVVPNRNVGLERPCLLVVARFHQKRRALRCYRA